jgi:hypothetical protein
MAVLAHHHVRRLDVAVQQAGGMQCINARDEAAQRVA